MRSESAKSILKDGLLEEGFVPDMVDESRRTLEYGHIKETTEEFLLSLNWFTQNEGLETLYIVHEEIIETSRRNGLLSPIFLVAFDVVTRKVYNLRLSGILHRGYGYIKEINKNNRTSIDLEVTTYGEGECWATLKAIHSRYLWNKNPYIGRVRITDETWDDQEVK